VVALREHADLGLDMFEGLDGEVVVAEGVAGELLFRVTTGHVTHYKRAPLFRVGFECSNHRLQEGAPS
jgi:alpha-acetolactate decarboxylase